MFINATSAQNLEMHCIGGAKCQGTMLLCPNNDYTIDGDWGSSCMYFLICCLLLLYYSLHSCF